MKKRKILYICSGVFNCVVGGVGCFFGLMFLALSKLARKMFSESAELINDIITSVDVLGEEYLYLKEASKDEILDFIMNLVYIVSVVLIVLGLIWIAFGVFNCLLSKRHYRVFGKRRGLKILFIVASWLLLTFNVANITTTIAVFKKDKDVEEMQTLYSSDNNA
jgi:hypothetical protein